MDDVRVGREDEPAIADADGRAVVHRGEADAVGREPADQAGQADLLDERAHRPPAGAVLQADPVVDQTAAAHATPPRSGCPPYWCQILQVPSLLTMQAPTGRSGVHSLPKSVQSVGDVMPAMMSPQMHDCASAGGA